MQNFRFMKPYPLFKWEAEEVPSKTSKSIVYRIYVKIAEPMEWVCVYTTFSNAWCELAVNKLKDIFDLYIVHMFLEDDADTYFPMFEVNNQVYKTQFVFPEQSCICGEQIAGNQRYAEFNVDYEKFDYIVDTVFFYDKGTCLVKGNQLFLDGKLLANSTQLADMCKNIGQEFNRLDTDPQKMIKYLQENYKNVNKFICNGYTSFFNKGSDE